MVKIQAMAQSQALAGGQVVVALSFLAGGAEIAPRPAGGAARFFVLRIKMTFAKTIGREQAVGAAVPVRGEPEIFRMIKHRNAHRFAAGIGPVEIHPLGALAPSVGVELATTIADGALQLGSAGLEMLCGLHRARHAHVQAAVLDIAKLHRLLTGHQCDVVIHQHLPLRQRRERDVHLLPQHGVAVMHPAGPGDEFAGFARGSFLDLLQLNLCLGCLAFLAQPPPPVVLSVYIAVGKPQGTMMRMILALARQAFSSDNGA